MSLSILAESLSLYNTKTKNFSLKKKVLIGFLWHCINNATSPLILAAIDTGVINPITVLMSVF